MPTFNTTQEAITHLEGIIEQLTAAIQDQHLVTGTIIGAIKAEDHPLYSRVLHALEIAADHNDSPGAKDLLSQLQRKASPQSEKQDRPYLRIIEDDPDDT